MTLEDRLAAAFARVAATVGLEKDWAAQFTGLLTPPVALAAASKTAAGLMRFATDAEAVAGTYDAAALTPKQALALARAMPLQYGSLTSLFAGTPVEGAVASVGRNAYSAGILHRASTWQATAGCWTPVGNTITVEAADVAGTLTALNSVAADVTTAGSKAYLPPGTRGNNISATSIGGQTYRWTGSKWSLVSTGAPPQWASGWSDWDSSATPPTWRTTFVREGRHVAAAFALGRTDHGTFPAGPLVVGTIPVGFRPTNNVMTMCASYKAATGGFTGFATIESYLDGTIKWTGSSETPGNINGVFGSTTWEAAD